MNSVPLKVLVSAVVLGMSSQALAQEGGGEGAYLGASLGKFDYEETVDAFGVEFSDSATAYRIFGGYRFNENFALEAGWGATGDLEETYTDGFDTAVIRGDYEVLTVRALAIAPFDSVSLYGGVGYYDATLDGSVSIIGFLQESFEGDDSGATLVGGLQFDLDKVSIRAEYEWFDTDSSVDAWDISVGLLFRL